MGYYKLQNGSTARGFNGLFSGSVTNPPTSHTFDFNIANINIAAGETRAGLVTKIYTKLFAISNIVEMSPVGIYYYMGYNEKLDGQDPIFTNENHFNTY